MEFGDILLWCSAAALITAIVAFYRGEKHKGALRQAEILYHAVTVLLTVAMGYLLYLFLADKFMYSYVNGYSARDQELFYKISALWAGQEGTFLLWAWMVAVLGTFVVRRGGPLMPRAMVYFLLTQLFLLTLMFVRSPFAHLPATAIPFDGQGLNPLLKDPWMVIHPPIVFLGYGAFTIPFCYGLAALARRKWNEFATHSFHWAAFAVATLGAGIFIGGFWAYKVLGWGGYWGWDPVENASLIPWLTGLALLHGLVVMRGSGKLLKTTLGLAMVSYVLVVYGTFLTRSGVLADFSVHSFTDLGINVHLTVFLIITAVYSIGRLLYCTRNTKPPSISTSATSREFGIVMGIVLLSLTAVLVWLGTSSPIFTTIAGNPANVSTAYYNLIAVPIGIFIALILGFSPFLLFERMPIGELFRAALPGILGGCIVTAVTFWFVSISALHAILIFGTTLAVISNTLAIIRFSQGQLVRMAGHLTHFGFGIMVIGILASSAYGTDVRVDLQTGKTASAFGYDMNFLGKTVTDKAEESHLNIAMTRGDDILVATPRLYVSPYNGQEMRKPSVLRSPLYDIYVAPLEHRAMTPANVLHIVKGQSAEYGDWTLNFTGFEVGSHEETGAMRVGAVIKAVRDDDTLQFTPALESNGPNRTPIPTELPGTGIRFSLTSMSVEQKLIELTVDDPGAAADNTPNEVLLAEVSKKPLIAFVWAGTILITIGTCLSIWRRKRESVLFE